MKKNNLSGLFVSLFLLLSSTAWATKLVEVKVVDKDYLMVSFKDGDVEFVDDGLGQYAYTSRHQADNNYVVTYGNALSTGNASSVSNWVLKSTNDPVFGTSGLQPVNCYRKSKPNGHAEFEWTGSDFRYEYTMEHHIYLQLPQSMTNGKTYTLEINSNTNTDVTSQTFTYDIFNSRSEAVHVNLVGYSIASSIKAADLYIWMGDGDARDYSGFEGNGVYVYDVNTSQSYPVGVISLHQNRADEASSFYMIQSDVWKADFTGFNTPGTYRVAIEGVGCSEDFEIAGDIYYEPFKVSTQGYYYMRIGEDRLDMEPVPRRPLYIPGVSPSDCKVYITSMDPYEAAWPGGGDRWDQASFFANYVRPGSPENPNAYGGHSDAFDWDRHIGHSTSIYDILLPYLLTDGAINDDDLDIGESGNGIPDIIDEARNEVDFFLRLRYQGGYSHGLSNPNTTTNTLYQADNTPIAAWANAVNAAMLADAFRVAGLTALMAEYRDSAINAYNYACALADHMLDGELDRGGETVLRGRDLKMTAAAYLYNLTGNTAYEDVINAESLITGPSSAFCNKDDYNQLYAMAAYLKTPQTVHYPTLRNNMAAAAIYQAKQKEANYTLTRPSRRATDNTTGWWHTIQFVQRCILAHAVATDPADKAFLENALVLEADWGLGRNSANVIQMTTATTALETKKSILQCYTTGWDDGALGVHPGHTPYMGLSDWSSQVMGSPSYLTSKGYPVIGDWPRSEAYYDTRYIYAHAEFTPQQTMRGKQALYGYLYGISPVLTTGVADKQSLTNVKKSDFSIYPNPTKDVIFFNLKENQAQTIFIYNSLGQLVMEEPYIDNSIEVSELNKGIYFLVIKGISKNFYAKFIIE